MTGSIGRKLYELYIKNSTKYTENAEVYVPWEHLTDGSRMIWELVAIDFEAYLILREDEMVKKAKVKNIWPLSWPKFWR